MTTKSVVTCDMEGRIETFGAGAEEIFGWKAEEVVGKKRVSLFSPGLVVLAHVGRWLAEAREAGEHRSRTVFVRKDGSRFAAEVRITPTKKDGKQIGYCGVTTPLPDVDPDTVMPPIPAGARILRWVVITRAPFLTAAIVPVLVGAALARHIVHPFPWLVFVLALVGAIALQVAANTFNDYFDWTSGTDEANVDYFQPFSGGSRAIELGLVSARAMFRVGVVSVLVAAVAGFAILLQRGPLLLAFGAAGALIAYFYTAPPLRLVARRGLGELSVALAFGPLMTAGTVFALTGTVPLAAWLVGVPIGLLTTAILYINEFPDAVSDAVTGKNHLVVILGKRTARWGYLAIVACAFAFAVGCVAGGQLPLGALLMLVALPVAIGATRVLFAHYDGRELVKANDLTIKLHMLAGVLTAVGVAFLR